MTPKVLTECGFADSISNAEAQTQSGIELIKNYKTYCMTQPVSCGIVNKFVKDASSMRYDTGINNVLEEVVDYLESNKVGWQIASVCEKLLTSNNSRDYLNKNAARQAEKLLEMDEENIIKYIRSGALKNIMFCEAFRNIANGVFKNSTQIYEEAKEYIRRTPVSMVENLGDSVAFVVCGRLFLQDELGQVQETLDWNQVSQTFKVVESLLESKLVEIGENSIKVRYNNQEYEVNEELGENKIMHGDKELSIDQLREENELYLRVANPRFKNQMAQVLESIALLCANFNKVAALDNVNIFETNSDKFMVIENNEKLFASSLGGLQWQVNDDAIKVLEFLSKKTSAKLDEIYHDAAQKAFEVADEQSKEEIKKTLEENTILSIKERIASLTEKFKNDPTKLAVLSKCASELVAL